MILSVIILIGLAATFHKWVTVLLAIFLGVLAAPFIPFLMAFKMRLKQPKKAKALLFSGCCFVFAIALVLLIPRA